MTKAARFSEAACTEHDNNGRLDQTGHHQFAAVECAIIGGLYQARATAATRR